MKIGTPVWNVYNVFLCYVMQAQTEKIGIWFVDEQDVNGSDWKNFF